MSSQFPVHNVKFCSPSQIARSYKIIAVDMDGTLLNDKRLVPEYNKDMIYKAIELGVKFVICSGRPPMALKFYSEELFPKEPMICCNGAVIIGENKSIIKSNPLNRYSLLRVIDLLREEKDTYYHFYDDFGLYSEQFRYTTKKFYDNNNDSNSKFKMKITIVKNSKTFIKHSKCSISKIVVIDEDVEYLNRLRGKIDKVPGITTTKSDLYNIEIVSRGVSKGKALEFLAGYYKVPMGECIAIGNDENDKSMISAAGLGVAVRNSREILKKSADYITDIDNNSGAVGEVIKKFIL
ncbi:Cof-type HAD-IIB family hydrolase [Clostridium sp. WILCCON 0269]|uniref:Cof-type HAD-IIB family hydrolase n=1 Tax=Candidatus Clostridium eludens TaxID=3381663 RepID=A0ABW8SMU0_9CLOT